MILKDKEIEYQKSYKHDSGTENISQHLLIKYKISSLSDDFYINTNEKY